MSKPDMEVTCVKCGFMWTNFLLISVKMVNLYCSQCYSKELEKLK